MAEDEQRRIADFLDDRVSRIDRIIAARREQVNLVATAQNSIADDLLLQVVDLPWVRLGTFVTGIEQGWSPQCDSAGADEGEWGVVKVSAVQRGHFQERENKRLPDDVSPRLEYRLLPGDLLVTRANSPDRVGYFTVVPEGVRDRLILCDKIMRLEIDDRVEPRFVSLVGQSRRTRDRFHLAATGTSDSMVNIRGDDVRGVPIPVIPMARQRALVADWERGTIENRERSAQLMTSIDLLAEYKASLITAAVTGELDVTTAGSTIPE
ncbi:MAG: hypothetical protein WAW85_12570 [Gordonia sp. (in: high G+C Gram-positive bacteria)]